MATLIFETQDGVFMLNSLNTNLISPFSINNFVIEIKDDVLL